MHSDSHHILTLKILTAKKVLSFTIVNMMTATILAKDSAETLEATLRSLQSFPEVVVFDTGSKDATCEIALRFSNVRLIQGTFKGFGPTHNEASSSATYDWIFSVDSDEVLSPELAKEIASLSLSDSCVYSIPRHNYFRGKWIRCCAGWYPDRIVRLYNRKTTRFTDAAVHERVISDSLRVIPLTSPLLHTPYRSISAFLDKMQKYSTLFAEENCGKRNSSLTAAIVHAFFAFWKSYLLKRGFLGGAEGFIISLYNAHTAYYKYLKLAEYNKKRG
jgi:glycosyltransferase involved in cell wall biosynthesis